jgi:hypothetical protein
MLVGVEHLHDLKAVPGEHGPRVVTGWVGERSRSSPVPQPDPPSARPAAAAAALGGDGGRKLADCPAPTTCSHASPRTSRQFAQCPSPWVVVGAADHPVQRVRASRIRCPASAAAHGDSFPCVVGRSWRWWPYLPADIRSSCRDSGLALCWRDATRALWVPCKWIGRGRFNS